MHIFDHHRTINEAHTIEASAKASQKLLETALHLLEEDCNKESSNASEYLHYLGLRIANVTKQLESNKEVFHYLCNRASVVLIDFCLIISTNKAIFTSFPKLPDIEIHPKPISFPKENELEGFHKQTMQLASELGHTLNAVDPKDPRSIVARDLYRIAGAVLVGLEGNSRKEEISRYVGTYAVTIDFKDNIISGKIASAIIANCLFESIRQLLDSAKKS